MAQQTTAIVKQKKKWFTVLAPEVFGSRELADLPAFAAEDLKKRVVEVTGQMLTNVGRDSNRKYSLQVTELKGDKAVTVPKAYYLTEGFVQRSSKKYKEKFILVPELETKDGKKVEIKIFVFNITKLSHSVRAALLKKTEELARIAVKEIESDKLFDPLNIEKLGNDMRKDMVQIYPVEKVLAAKIRIL
jgi:small subunit ribosomal protein S3Ae